MGVAGPPDHRISAIATAQRGRVARRQLIAAAISEDMIRTRLRSRYLIPVHTGVYAVAHLGTIPLANETAALLAVGDDAVVSHLTAAVRWELIRHPDGPPIRLTTPHARLRRDGIVVHRSRTLTNADIRHHRGLPVTSPGRTVFDLAELRPLGETERALDEALARKLVTLAELHELAKRMNGRSAAGIVTRLITWRTSNTGSRTKWERKAAKAFVAADLPPVEQNVWYLGYQHDFLWRKHGVTLEIDGYPWHGTKTNMERDRQKESKLKQHSVDPNRVSNTMVEHNILQVLALMSARLALRDPANRGGYQR